jgi:hypothetical protein
MCPFFSIEERSREYTEAVERGDVPFEPPPLDAQINGNHAELLRQAALYTPGSNAPRTRPADSTSSAATPHTDAEVYLLSPPLPSWLVARMLTQRGACVDVSEGGGRGRRA